MSKKYGALSKKKADWIGKFKRGMSLKATEKKIKQFQLYLLNLNSHYFIGFFISLVLKTMQKWLKMRALSWKKKALCDYCSRLKSIKMNAML